MKEIMDKELYVFSNLATPPVPQFIENTASKSEYADLSNYMHEDIACFPNYIPFKDFKKDDQTYLNYFKEQINKAGLLYEFIHVYTIERTEYNPPAIKNETYYYKWNHKEFNLKNKRKRA